MARNNLPSHLAKEFGRKNYTKAELAEKERTEVILSGEDIKPSPHLPSHLHEKFYWLVGEFEDVGILSNVDSDAISRYIMADDSYWKMTEVVNDMDFGDPDYNKMTNIQNRYYGQSKELAKELGLTMVSRMKLRKDESKTEPEPKTDEDFLFGDKLKVVP